MADIDLNSYTNTSAVSDVALGIVLHADSVVNSSIVSDVTESLVTYLTSLTNVNSIGPIRLGIGTRPNSLVNSSSIGLVSRLPDQIGVNSVINISHVGDVVIPTFVNTSLPSVVNESVVPLVMITGGLIVDNSITPVTRPIKGTSTATTGLKKFVFRDIALKGGSHPLTGDLVTVTDFNAVAQSIRNIVMTNPTERFFDHIDFGVGIEKYLFDVYDNGLQDRIKEDIISQIALYEPRALILDVILDGEAFMHQLSIEIVFKIKTTQVTSSLTVLLERR